MPGDDLPEIMYWNNKGTSGRGTIEEVWGTTHVPFQTILRVLRGWKKNPSHGWYFRALSEWPQRDNYDDVGCGLVPRHYREGSPGRISKPMEIENGPTLLQLAIQHEPGKSEELFREMDCNGNGKLSLAEIDKEINDKYPSYDHKPVLLRAMKLADREGNRDGLMELPEFQEFIGFLSSYTDMWKVFESVDSGHDRKINAEEFARMGPRLTDLGIEMADTDAAFREADRNGGGEILFDEFCFWVARKKGDNKMGSKDGLVGYVDSTGHQVGEGGV